LGLYPKAMKLKLGFLFCLFIICVQAQTKLLSWNLKDFGASKSEETITFIAQTLRDYDIVALQEIVAGEGGARAVARLAAELNTKGSKWDYTISEPTRSSSYKTERYAFLWKTSKVQKKGDAWLETHYQMEIDREPYLCTFQYGNKQFTIVNFHAITKKMQPETEIKYFKFFPELYPGHNLVFAGDFNCPQLHSVFNPLKKMGYAAVFVNQRTSLRQRCLTDGCLASEYDNIFYRPLELKAINSGVLLFFEAFGNLKLARKVSDHVPIWMELEVL
jgi:endonuclease/exonuclease/phosphatase family metal-dependent hydrolase